MELVSRLVEEWRVIADAPLTFIAAVFLACSVSYLTARWRFATKIDHLEERLRLRDDRIKNLEQTVGSTAGPLAQQDATRTRPDPVTNVVSSFGQSGGVTANTVNIRNPVRSLDSPDGAAIKRDILTHLPRDKLWSVPGIVGDMESCQFAGEIYKFMEESGFKMNQEGYVAIVPSKPVIGIQVWTPKDSDKWSFVVGARP